MRAKRFETASSSSTTSTLDGAAVKSMRGHPAFFGRHNAGQVTVGRKRLVRRGRHAERKNVIAVRTGPTPWHQLLTLTQLSGQNIGGLADVPPGLARRASLTLYPPVASGFGSISSRTCPSRSW